MSFISCVVCGTSIDKDRYRRSSIYGPNDREYKLYHCPECGLEFWQPMEFYAKFYEEELPEHEIISLGYRPVPPPARMFFARSPEKKGKLLDVGCGDGAFLEEAKGRGIDVSGIDLDGKAVKAAKEIRGLNNVHAAYLKDYAAECRAKGIRFDVVTFFDVLEHQDDPNGFIGDVKACLKRGGIIAGSVPNKDRILPETHEADVLGDLPPAHFSRWSKRSLSYFLASRGFEDLVIVPFGFDSVWDITGWIRSHLLAGFTKFLKAIILGKAKSTADAAPAPNKAAAGTIKFVSDMILFPFAIIMFPVFKRRGSHLYFQAVLKGAANQ